MAHVVAGALTSLLEVEKRLFEECKEFLPFRYIDPSLPLVVTKNVARTSLTRWEKMFKWSFSGSLVKRLFRELEDLHVARDDVERVMKVNGEKIRDEFKEIMCLLVAEEIGLVERDAGEHGDTFTVRRIRVEYEKRLVSFVMQVWYLLYQLKEGLSSASSSGAVGVGDGGVDGGDGKSAHGVRAVRHLQSLAEASCYFRGSGGEFFDEHIVKFIAGTVRSVHEMRERKYKEVEKKLDAYGGAGERTPVAKGSSGGGGSGVGGGGSSRKRKAEECSAASTSEVRKKKMSCNGGDGDKDKEYRPRLHHQHGGKGWAMVKVTTMRSRVDEAQRRILEHLRAIGTDVHAIDDEMRAFFLNGFFRESGGLMNKFSFTEREQMRVAIDAIQAVSSADKVFAAMGTDTERAKQLCEEWTKDATVAQTQPGFIAIGHCLLGFYMAQMKKKDGKGRGA
eukprot:483104-Rhodomonas_salina.4